jgi:hypothetical protein
MILRMLATMESLIWHEGVIAAQTPMEPQTKQAAPPTGLFIRLPEQRQPFYVMVGFHPIEQAPDTGRLRGLAKAGKAALKKAPFEPAEGMQTPSFGGLTF